MLSPGTSAHHAGVNCAVVVYGRGPLVQYRLGWTRSAQDPLHPPEIVRHFPETVRGLPGYQLEARHCGQLEQGVGPIVILRV